MKIRTCGLALSILATTLLVGKKSPADSLKSDWPRRHQAKAEADALFSEQEMVKWVKDQVAFGMRHPGSPAEKANEQYLVDTLKSFGLNAYTEKVLELNKIEAQPETKGLPRVSHPTDAHKPIMYWNVNEEASEFRVYNNPDGLGTKIQSYPIAHTAFKDTADKIMVYADPEKHYSGNVKEWKNRIVVVDIVFPPIPADKFLALAKPFGIYDPDHSLLAMDHGATWVRKGFELYDVAVRSGAAGFVGILTNQDGGDFRMYAPYGFKERDMLNKPIPGVWVSSRDHKTLVDAAKNGVAARLQNVGESIPTEANNVIAEIPGKTDEAIILSSHTDSPFFSPVEDASGVAVVLALAKHFAERVKKEGPLHRKIIVVLSAGHFYGSVGTRSFIQTHHEDLIKKNFWGESKAVLEISIEHIAREATEKKNEKGFRDGHGPLIPTIDYNHPTGRPEPTAIFMSFNTKIRDTLNRALYKYDFDRTVLLGAQGPLGDFPPSDGGDWYTAGIPTINHIANPVYLLTDSGDQIDPVTKEFKWLASERLTRAAAVYRQVILDLHRARRSDLFSSGITKGWLLNKAAKLKISLGL